MDRISTVRRILTIIRHGYDPAYPETKEKLDRLEEDLRSLNGQKENIPGEFKK